MSLPRLAVPRLAAAVLAVTAAAFSLAACGSENADVTGADLRGIDPARVGSNLDASLCFEQPADDFIAVADEIMSGKLTLDHHPAVDLPANPTWDENPLDDRNWQFQYHSLLWLPALKHAWDETGDDRYLNRYAGLLRSWFESNPFDDPPSDFSWYDFAAALRASTYACASSTMPGQAWLRDAVDVHGEVLSDPDFYTGHGNHALGQDMGLIASGCIASNDEWMSLGLRRLGELLAESIDEEGVTNEQAVDYQEHNFAYYGTARDLLETCDLPVPAEFDRLDLMPEFLAHATLPDGTYVMLGDTGYGRLGIAPLDGTTAEFAATKGESGTRPEGLSAIYRNEGFLFGRTGWGTERPFEDEIFYSFSFGPPQYIHGHDDGGSVTLYGHGSRLIMDSGSYMYEFDENRDYVVSAEAHNLITTDLEPRDDEAETELLRHESDDEGDLTVVRQQPYDGVETTRTVAFSRAGGFMLVEDRVSSETPTGIRQLWHLTEDADPSIDGSTVVTNGPEGRVAIFQLADQPGINVVEGQRDPVQGWVSYEYGGFIPAPVIEATIAGTSARFLTLLVPFAGDDPPEVSWSTEDLGDDGFTATIEIDGKSHRVSTAG